MTRYDPYLTFQDAYLVRNGDVLIGVVRRDVHVWRALRFGVAQQSTEVFATREAAGRSLLTATAKDAS